HALALRRVDGCAFDVAAFTNFSQDHLDFHGSMQEYFRAKTRLFDHLREEGSAVLNYDDPMIRGIAGNLRCNVITCGLQDGAMIKAENIKEYGIPAGGRRSQPPRTDTDTGTDTFALSFDIRTPRSRFRVGSRLMGRFNVYNILMSAGIAYALGFSDEVIQKGIQEAQPVEGRFEYIDAGQGFLCIVDYAHTEDALRNVLQEARAVTRGRLITVFGCGGDRDRSKRPLMGAVASALSDLAVITSDNPRSEDPLDIIRDIVSGIKKDNYMVRPDREEAIMEAVSMAREGDTVLVAGKGHEDYQEIRGVRHYFSDREVLRKAIKYGGFDGKGYS
ncbi:MAG: UDP-N-acetylmuramoyl-L-alanyl-D-glutamate--2,6-diaminopimelate ligase, partial [Deferribacteres bacterium]|nr:UDP-N-acetylmuramoyl-L-alanyl-D-glutamate--2,6-diaminopimelate ligase [Deferribacteres bacterium]